MNAPHRAPSLFTDAEFQRLVRSGGFGDARVELRRGAIVKMSPQYVRHAGAKMELTLAIMATLQAANVQWKVWNEVSVAFGGGFEPLPDIVVWDDKALPIEPDGPIPAAAVRLIVEVADTTLADDLGEKLEDYAKGGLEEYWVVDVKGRLILRHAEPASSGYARRQPILFGAPASWLTRPNLIVSTAALT